MTLLKFSKGFTLVEILVAVSILGIAGAIVLPSLFSTRENERLNSASKEIVAWLDDLRRKAIQTSEPCRAIWSTETGILSGRCGNNANIIGTLNINNEIYGGGQDISITLESVPSSGDETEWIFTPRGTSTTQREARLSIPGSNHGRCIQLSSPLGLVQAAKINSADQCDYTTSY